MNQQDQDKAKEYVEENYSFLKAKGSLIQCFLAGAKYKEQQQWIPVTDDLNLPKNERYLVLYSTTSMGGNTYHQSVSSYSRGRFSGEFDWTKAIFYMPLPNPPSK